MQENTFYITTTLPYVNSDPHIGFAAEIVHADILARYHKQLGQEVFFNTGTDEHGLKIYQNAVEKNITPQAYVDEYAAKFKELEKLLNLSVTKFIRTTDPSHMEAAKEFWNKCLANGDIYKKAYQVKYCVGCELEKTESELVDGKCPLHPNREIEFIEEENYFFAFSKFQQKLLDLYKSNPDFVVPDFRFHEIKAFVEQGLQDFSISRLKEKMPWGVEVPGDETQVMYVWFDALINYISTLGWPDEGDFKKFWPGVQIAGKDNLRQQSAMWQAMLMSAGLPTSKQIIIRGFITSGGQKMSKSLGNVISPVELVEKYGTDALRYFIAKDLNPFEDSDFTIERFEESYTAGLVNGLGNQISRIVKMAKDNGVTTNIEEELNKISGDVDFENYHSFFKTFAINKIADLIWDRIQSVDKYIQEKEPFKLVKSDPDQGKEIIEQCLKSLVPIAYFLEPILPNTSQKIFSILKDINGSEVPRLFPRLIK